MWAQGSGHTRELQKSRVQGRVYNCCSTDWFGVRATLPCQGQPERGESPQSRGRERPGGPGGEALSLPGTLIKPCGDARRRHPSLHTQITSYMCFIYCDIFN